MKTITAFEKKGKHIWVTVGDQSFPVEPEMIIKYHLKAELEMEDKTYQTFITENQYLQCLRFSFVKLKKMLTIAELKNILALTSFPLGIQKQVIHYLIEKKYLDDYAFAKMYLDQKKTKEGPEMLKFHLQQKGISLDILEKTMQHHREDVVVQELIEKKLNTPTKKPKRAYMRQIKQQLVAKGFHREMVESCMMSHEDLLENKDQEIIHVYGQKIIKQYQNKLSGYALYQKIKEKLYQKGFAYEDIKRYLETIDLQSW